MPVQNIVDCTGHITGGHNKNATFFAESFFDPMNDLDREKKLVDLHMFDGVIVCIKAQNIFRVVYPMISCIFRAEHTYHNMFKVWKYIEEITKLCRKDKVC